jgi:pimeloyl-ACP methyl ester carboxylesterase
VAKGRRFYVEDSGQGPVVMLLHGFPATSTLWRAQVEALVGAGYRCCRAQDLHRLHGAVVDFVHLGTGWNVLPWCPLAAADRAGARRAAWAGAR